MTCQTNGFVDEFDPDRDPQCAPLIDFASKPLLNAL